MNLRISFRNSGSTGLEYSLIPMKKGHMLSIIIRMRYHQKIKESRVSELMAIQQSISEELNKKKTGKILKVIIDRREGEFFIGRTEYDCPEVDNEVLISTEYDLKPGNFYDILITGATDFDLFGKPDDLSFPL